MDLMEECRGAGRIAVSAHTHPDGDAIGSTMALYLYLQKRLPDAVIKLFLETPPDNFGHLEHLGEIDSSYTDGGVFDVFFLLDTTADRLGDAEKYFQSARKRVNIDHHISNADGCGDVNFVRPDASSTSELVYELLDKTYLDKEIATAIFTGIIHDTGIFQYSCTTPRTLQIAAELLSYGFDFSRIIEESFCQKTFLQNQMLGRALLDSVRFMENRCIYSCVTLDMMKKYGAVRADLDGIVNQLRNTKGVDCAIFLVQVGEDEYKVSLRSGERVDVARIASHFHGGGHVRAAGCTMKGTVPEIIERLSEQIRAAYRGE